MFDPTATDLFAFDLNGYLVIDNAIDSEHLAALQAELPRWQAEAEAERVSPTREHLSVKQDGREVKLVDVVHHEPLVHPLITNPRLLPLLDAVIPSLRFKSSWLDFKWPGAGTRHHSHHTPFDGADHYVFHGGRICAQTVTVCYALADIGPEDGALEVIPGSHKSNFPLPPDPDPFRQRLPLKAGQAVVFCHNLNHGSMNRGSLVRKALFTSFCSSFLANSYGGDQLYADLFAAAEPGSWQQWLLRAPNGAHQTCRRPAGPIPGSDASRTGITGG